MIGNKRLLYYVMCVSAFAGVKNLCQKDAYHYLEKYKGIDFLEECYDAEHCLSIDDAVDDLTAQEAMKTFYESEVFDRLCDTETGLYRESGGYVYDLFKIERKHGHLVQVEI